MARDDFTSTVDGAAGHAARYGDEYDPRDDLPTAAELAQDDADLARWYEQQAHDAARSA